MRQNQVRTEPVQTVPVMSLRLSTLSMSLYIAFITILLVTGCSTPATNSTHLHLQKNQIKSPATPAEKKSTPIAKIKGTNITPNVIPNKAPNTSPNTTAKKAPQTIQGTNITPNVVSYRDYNDPLIKFNRAVFVFNDVTYRYALIPLAKGYNQIVPEPVDKSVGNFFYNIKSPIYILNNMAQLKLPDAGKNLLRFVINSTLGIAGLFDPAKVWFNIEKKESHVEDTIAHYGGGYGTYLVLPLLGSSDLRNGTSSLVEVYLNPIPYVLQQPDASYVQAFDYFQEFAPSADNYAKLRGKSDDPYIFFRNLYLQGVQRDAEFGTPH